MTEKQSAFEAAKEKWIEGSYDAAAQELHALLARYPEDTRIRLHYLVCLGLSAVPVKGEALIDTWEQAAELLKQTPQQEFWEEARQLFSVYANAVYIHCNEWQKLEYALLQKDVNFEKKELVLKEFQKILLKADVEYKAILKVYYGYASLCAEYFTEPDIPASFLEGALKTMTDAAKLQGEIGLEEDYNPMDLALAACRLPLSQGMTEAWDMRRELLDLCLHGEEALARWEEFAPYANPSKQKELTAEVNKLRRRARLKFWKRPRSTEAAASSNPPQE